MCITNLPIWQRICILNIPSGKKEDPEERLVQTWAWGLQTMMALHTASLDRPWRGPDVVETAAVHSPWFSWWDEAAWPACGLLVTTIILNSRLILICRLRACKFTKLVLQINNSTAQRLDLFAWCVRLSRLLVGFRTHFKSLHFYFIHSALV